MQSMWSTIAGLVPFVGLVGLAAVTGARFQPGAWYRALNKPSWTPPDWAFPVVWSTLYVMIAIAGWLVWSAEGAGLAFWLWCAQLVANAAWSWIMFGRRQIALALADALLMWVLIAAFIVVAWPVSQIAALLFVPYLAWVTAATLLNLSILRQNPDHSPAS